MREMFVKSSLCVHPKNIVHFGVGGARPRFWRERGLELEAWRLWMTGCPLDTSGQKWTEPGMSPIVRSAIVATAATTAKKPRSLCRPSVWNGPICGSGTLSGSRASQFVQTQNWFEDISHCCYCCKHAAKTLQFFAVAGRVFELSKSLEVSSFPCKLSRILGKLGTYLC